MAHVSVIDPQTSKAWIYTSDVIRDVRDSMLRTEGPQVVAPLHALFSV